MGDLANVYQLFRSKFENDDFQYYYPPSYIRTITECNDKIIFAYKENINKNNSPQQKFKDSPNDSTNGYNKLDFTGSPLKDEISNIDEFDITDGKEQAYVLRNYWTPEEEAYGPLDTEQARTILQKFINLDCKLGCGDIWVLCSGTDTDRTVLLQLAVNANVNDHRRFVRGVVRTTGVVQRQNYTMAQLVELHRRRAEGMRLNPKIHIRQWYNLSPSITVRLSWHTMSENASFAFERNARVRLSHRFPLKHGAFSLNSPAEGFWLQLQRLSLMKDKILDIRANREAGYRSIDVCADGINEVDLEYVKQRVSNILSTFITVQPTKFVQGDIAGMVEQVRLRNLTDVMERLYEALTLCSSYEDLKASIDYIFHLSTHSNIVNVPTTGTRFAQLILAMIQDRLAIPSLTPSEPYELLLECGFAKLMNDYRLIFAECGIYELEFEKLFQSQPTNTRKSRYASGISPQSTEMVSGTKMRGSAASGGGTMFQQAVEVSRPERSILLSNFDEEEASTKLNRLAQVQLLLEHLLALAPYVAIPSIYGRLCEVYLAQRPYNYGEVYNRDTDLLELDLNEFQLMDMVKNETPFGRRVAMSSTNLLQKLETVFLQYGQPILPECFFADSKQDDEEERQENGPADKVKKFWCYEYDRIERL